MITFSHNHCGPRLGDDLVDYYPVEAEQVKLVDEYTAAMVEKTGRDGRRGARGARPRAAADRQGPSDLRREPAQQPRGRRPGPARAGQAAGRAGGSRRAGPDRHAAGRVASRRSSSATPATRRRSTSRPGAATIRASPSSSWSRPTRAPSAMFVNTCGGDQNPLPRRSVELCRRYGQMLADAVEEALKGPLRPVSADAPLGLRLRRPPVPEGRHPRRPDRRHPRRPTPSAPAGPRACSGSSRRARRSRRRIRTPSTPGGSATTRSSSAWAPRRSSTTRCGSSASSAPAPGSAAMPTT